MPELRVVGQPVQRVDAEEKLTGEAALQAFARGEVELAQRRVKRRSAMATR